MSKWIALSLAFFVFPGFAQAQNDGLIKDFTPNHLEKFIKDVLRIDAKKTEIREENRIAFSTPDGQFDIEYRGGAKKTIVFLYPYKSSLKVSLDKINEWNLREGNCTRAFLKKGVAYLGGTVNLDGGLSFGQLKAYYQEIQQERREFEQLIIPQKRQEGGRNGDAIRQTFPARTDTDSHKTSWEVVWDFVPNFNNKVQLLRIVSAQFTFKDVKGKRKSVSIARNIQLVESFAAYDDGITAFLDLAAAKRADKTVAAIEELRGPNCVSPGQIVSYSKNPALKIFKEVHDDGIRWMTGFGKNNGYRGEKLILTSIFQAANYVYLVEYNFTDDGRIVCRLGFTAHNFYQRGKSSLKGSRDGDVHLHVGCWSMQFDLSMSEGNDTIGGPADNDYRLISRRIDQSTGRFKVADEPFGADFDERAPEAREGKALWKPEEFTTLRVQSAALRNAHQRPIAYDLIAPRFGSVRELRGFGDVAGKDMDFINYDYWITQSPEKTTEYHQVPGLAAKRRPLNGKPATVWYSASALHVPRGEDFGGTTGDTQGQGVALTSWVEFTLRPRDLFDGTPLYP